jgi:hypothetical protein
MPAASERAGVLVIRAWLEPEDMTLRARITGRLDVAVAQEMSCAVLGVDSATEVVRSWLQEFERARVRSVTEA